MNTTHHTMKSAQVKALIASLRAMPSAMVEVTNDKALVSATNRKTQAIDVVFKAERTGTDQWSVEAAAGLLSIK